MVLHGTQNNSRRVSSFGSDGKLLQQQRLRHPSIVMIATILLIGTFSTTINAFSITSVQQHTSSSKQTIAPTPYAPWNSYVSSKIYLSSANTDEGTTEQEVNVPGEGTMEDEPIVGSDSDVTEITSSSTDDNAPPVAIEEDPEIIAMKDEISKLEIEIKNARRQLADINDRADDYTKTGYARKVAEMENMRRARSMLQSSNKYSATASILTEFLPAMDTLISLREKYSENEFGKMYNALPDAIKSGFTSMGCTEYTVASNEMFVSSRMTKLDSEPSTTIPKDYVIRTVIPGMELQGNIIRLAQVITSSGNEATSSSETEQATTGTTTDADPSAESN